MIECWIWILRHGNNGAIFYKDRNFIETGDSYDFTFAGKFAGIEVIPLSLREYNRTLFLPGKQRRYQKLLPTINWSLISFFIAIAYGFSVEFNSPVISPALK